MLYDILFDRQQKRPISRKAEIGAPNDRAQQTMRDSDHDALYFRLPILNARNGHIVGLSIRRPEEPVERRAAIQQTWPASFYVNVAKAIP